MSLPQVGSHPLSPLFCKGLFMKDVPYWPHNYSLEKNQVPRELTLIAISRTYLVAQWYSYGGSWKWVTILSILAGMVHLLSDICFRISTYVNQQLHSLDCQHFVHYISLVLFIFLRTPHGCRVSFLKGTYNFLNCEDDNLYRYVHIKVHWKMSSFLPPSICSINLSPIQNLKEALNMSTGMYCNMHLLEIMSRSDFKSPLSYPSS